MGDSNQEWGQLASHDDELADAWDTYARLPEAGENAVLDALVEHKSITHGALVRLGARMASDTVIAFAFPGGIKYRNLMTDERWSYTGSTWHELKIVRHAAQPTSTIIVAEGETDAAWLTDHYACDVAVLPGGADPRPHTAAYAAQLAAYGLVLLGQDDDEAGHAGAAQLAAQLPQAVRFLPPANDWCASDTAPPIPDAPEFHELKVMVPAGELLTLETPEITSWFEHAILPVGGQLILHGWVKSFKSFIAIDMLSALAQGQDWATFEPSEEPCKVGVMQYEIPWPYYKARVQQLRTHAREPALFDSNFLTFTPMQRPAFTAGVTAQEDYVMAALETAGVQVFLLDPIRRATGLADLNSERDVRPLLNFCARLQDNGVTVVLCHHDNKGYSRQGGGDPLGMTGVGAFAGDADSIVSVALPKGSRLEDPHRNLHFTLRNAPSLGPRGMEMTDDGRLVYSTEPYGDGLAGDESGPPI